MQCPYCGIDMEKGVIQSVREIFWSHNKKKLIFKPDINKGDVPIASFGWNGSVGEAYLCRKCEKVIINI